MDIPTKVEQLLKPAGPEALARARAPAEKLKQYLSLQLNQAIARGKKIKQELSNFNYDEENGKRLAEANEILETIGDRTNREHKEFDDLIRAGQMFEQYLLVAKQVVTSISAASDAMRRILTEMAKPDADFQCVYEQWLPIEAKIFQDLTDDFRKSYEEQFASARNSFQSLLQVNLDYQFARQNAESSRRH